MGRECDNNKCSSLIELQSSFERIEREENGLMKQAIDCLKSNHQMINSLQLTVNDFKHLIGEHKKDLETGSKRFAKLESDISEIKDDVTGLDRRVLLIEDRHKREEGFPHGGDSFTSSLNSPSKVKFYLAGMISGIFGLIIISLLLGGLFFKNPKLLP